MKKTVVSFLLIMALALSLAGCGAAPAAAPQSGEAAEAPSEQDGQNPIMNFVGIYARDRASIEVGATDQIDGVKITVTWGSSAWEHSEWVMTGRFDTETLTVAYDDCVRTDYVFKEDGSVDTETVVYEDGTGTITFSDEDGLTLTWDDEMEHIADDMIFEYAV